MQQIRWYRRFKHLSFYEDGCFLFIRKWRVELVTRKLLMGNEAIALGAIRAGVDVVAGYPGTPSTEVLETIAKHRPQDTYIEWSINEKAGLEVAAGAAYTGARALVTMKQVGLNVASDPLMSLAYIGVKGGMVVLVADDPGPISSQTEQDTRHFAQYAHLPVFDPESPEDAYLLIGEAFAYSEKYHTPVIFRPTTQVCHACASIELDGMVQRHKIEGFVKDKKWVIFPRLSYENHIRIVKQERLLSEVFSEFSYNRMAGAAAATKGIISNGVSSVYVREVLADTQDELRTLSVATPHPFPEKLALKFLDGLTDVLVIEELDPVLEEALLKICGKYHLPVDIHGRLTDETCLAGANHYENVRAAIDCFMGRLPEKETSMPELPPLPVRPPVLCAGCPHRGSFYSVKAAMKRAGQKAVFTGDIGCYTLGNAKPLDMVDTCLCMGADITMAQGLHRVEPEVRHIAFIGDSTFFHTGIPGIINAVYNETDITVIILDNSTTAMTGHQPHPGTGRTMMGHAHEKVHIDKVLAGCNVGCIKKANPLHLEEAVAAVTEAVNYQGVSVVIFEEPCIALAKPRPRLQVTAQQCVGCQRCIKEIGCPAISLTEDGKAVIDQNLCYGCDLCRQICPVKAIGGAEK